MTVVVIDPGRDRGAGLGAAGEVLQGTQFELQSGVPRFDDRIVQRRSDPSHRQLDPDPLTGGAEPVSGVFAALIGVEDDPGDCFCSAAERSPLRDLIPRSYPTRVERSNSS
jgi:hypothetical protein